MKDVDAIARKNRSFTNQLADAVTCLTSKIDVVMDQNELLQKQQVKREDESRKINLLFVGLPEDKSENCISKVQSILVKDLQIKDTEIKLGHRLGPFQKGRTRPIIVRFANVEDRNVVLAAKRKLPTDKKITIAEHFSPETTAKRKALAPLIKICRAGGKRATLVGDQLLVEGKRYNIENISRLSEQGIDPQAPCMKKNDKILAFNGSLSILSNFYLCEFTVSNQRFYSNEQYYQYKKVIAGGRRNLATKILATKDPVSQKQTGGSTKLGDDQWNSMEEMKKGAIAKFGQNRQLWEYLKSTEGLELVHTNGHDNVWSTGKALSSQDILTKPGTGQNLLGKILMDIHDNDLANPVSNPGATSNMTMLAHMEPARGDDSEPQMPAAPQPFAMEVGEINP